MSDTLTTIDVRLGSIRHHKMSAYSKARSGLPFLIGVTTTGATIKGEMRKPIVGEQYRLWGEWREQKGYTDPAFVFTHHEVIIDKSIRGMAQYLMNHVPTIGYGKANVLVEAFGEDTIDVLRTHPERAIETDGAGVQAVLGITQANIDAIRKHFAESKAIDPIAYAKLIDLFREHRFPRKLVRALLDHWGSDAPSKVIENPYVLLAYPGVGWKSADAFAMTSAGYAASGIARHKAAIVEAIETIALDGHTFARKADVDAIAWKLIDALPSEAAWRELYGENLIVSVTQEILRETHGSWIYDNGMSDHEKGLAASEYSEALGAVFASASSLWALPKLDEAEREIADRLASLARAARPLAFDFDTDGLNDDQIAALDVIHDNGVGIIAGAPGTGKSYSCTMALAGLTKHGVKSIRVAAPTGKAAKRAAELLEGKTSADIPCTTIHRLLGPKPNEEPEGVPGDDAKFGRGRSGYGFTHNESRPLDVDFLVIDECSMVDVPLMASLLRAVAPGTRVVFVGDPNQLPSVGPGSVLRDMLDAGIPAATLTKIVRSDGGGSVVRACHAIKDGVVPRPAPSISLPTDNWIHLEVAEPDEIARTIVEIVESAKANGNYDPLWDIQVVAAQNEGRAIACRELNVRLADLLNPRAAGATGAAVGDEEFGMPFRVGDKIVRTKNGLCDLMVPASNDARSDWTWGGTKYELGETDVVNGDMGQVLDIVEGADAIYVVVRFRTPDRLCRLALGEAHLIQAYAMTAHKCQGSGFPWVIVPVHTDTYHELFTREWLYTAISRSERLLVTVGPSRAIDAAVGRKTVHRRRTRLAERIREVVDAAQGRGAEGGDDGEGVEAEAEGVAS